MTRSEVLSKAVDECLKECYKYVLPKVTWEEFIEENRKYSNKCKLWKSYNRAKESQDITWQEWQRIYPEWEGKSMYECAGPKPFEFYYLPKDILKDIVDSYIYAYSIDNQDTLLNTIKLLKEYCESPIVDKWIEREGDNPGYKDYDHPDNLEKELYKYLDSNFNGVEYENVKAVKDLFFKFLDMAGGFYRWDGELNSFNMSVYLGPSPNSNKKAVIRNWKQYRNTDINIDEKEINKEYYGEED